MTDRHCIFTTWLKAQRGRDDAVGDLARDAAADRHWPKAAKSLPRLLDYLAGRGGRRGDCCRGLPAGLGGVPCRRPTFAHGPRGRGVRRLGQAARRLATWQTRRASGRRRAAGQ